MINYRSESSFFRKRNFSGHYRNLFLKKAEVFSDENIKSVRPGYSTHPKHLKEFLGTIALRDYRFGDRLDR